MSTMYGGHQHHSFTCKDGCGGGVGESGKASYSLTTTFAPSLAKRRAALLPIPYASETGEVFFRWVIVETQMGFLSHLRSA